MAKILLVDDEKHILQYYSEELSEEGHQVVVLDSGHGLLKTIDHHQPEVVILDIKLREWNGLELLQEIRNRYYDLPVILCTAYDTFKEDDRTMAADYYVVKSLDLHKLKMAIERAVNSNRTE